MRNPAATKLTTVAFLPRSKSQQVLELIGRGGEIRTHDPLRPRQVRYQAALRPDSTGSFDSKPLPTIPIVQELSNAE